MAKLSKLERKLLKDLKLINKMNECKPYEKIILAIDGFDEKEAISFLENCPKISWVKIGLELFCKSGPEIIKILKKMDKKIFLDLKFFDIPNTMGATCYQVSKLGVDIISLHAAAGSKALKISKEASLEGSREFNLRPPSLVGVTILTSFSSLDLKNDFNIQVPVEENVLKLAELSFQSGLDGCVCSPWELKKLRLIYDDNFQLITPGIRLTKNIHHDQQRVMTPYEAILNGASKLVVGRSITKSKNPSKTFLDICGSII
tara:strand:- start:546 stop:1325 length:780 start_codon:yes stop_codon:yes gene_type:complete